MASEVSEAQVADAALRYLARREHSVVELQTKLLRKDFDPGFVARVLEDLTQRELVSDQRFAAELTRVRTANGYGPLRVRRDLKARGVDSELIDAALAAFDASWCARIVRVRERKFGNGQPRDYREWSRQATFLERRGFTGDQIRSALKGDPEFD